MKTKLFRCQITLMILALTAHLQAENSTAINEVLKLKNAGVAESTLIAFIQAKNYNFDLNADHILRLRDQGITAAVLEAMLASGAPPANTPQPAAAVPVSSQPQPVLPPSPKPAQPQALPGQPPSVTVAVTQPMANPDVAYFYQELAPHGRWIVAEDGQWCWQPAVGLSTPGWRPYWDKGRWIWTDHGWYWSSDYAWGWAAFHHGRWHLHPHHGWVWFPDRVWGPSWVVWRTGGDYCGWAPLPLGAVYDTAGARFVFRGRQVEAGFDFGLGLAHFNFCFTREMGEPIRQRFRGDEELRRIYGRTTILNNYAIIRDGGPNSRPRVFNKGIEPSRLHLAKGRSFEPVRIEELRTPAPGRAHERLDTRNRTLEIYRPKFNDHR